MYINDGVKWGLIMNNAKNIEINIANSKIVIDSDCRKNLERKDFSPIEILVGFVIPFVLFWGGMLSPFFSDKVFVWILALIPLYGFVFVGQMFSKGKYIELFAYGSILNIFSSILLTVLLFMIPESWIVVGKICRLALLNILPSLLLLFISMAYHFYENK